MAAVIHLGRWLPRRVVVAGNSMSPTLQSGDRLLVVPARRYREGRLVALRDPRDRDRVVVKRIDCVTDAGQGYVVLGDNPDGSTDSRHFGPVARADMVGCIVYRYGPPDRVGRIRPA